MPGSDPMEQDIKPDIQDDAALQQCPSPMAEAQDAAEFYTDQPAGHERHHGAQPAQPHEHDPGQGLEPGQVHVPEQMPEPVQVSEPVHEPEQGQVQVQDQDQKQGQGQGREEEQEQGQEQEQLSASPRLQVETAAITNVEELRIAAQLSQDLSQDLSHGITPILDQPNHHPNPNDEPSLRNGIAQHEPHSSHHDSHLPREDQHREPEQQQQQQHQQHNLNLEEHNHHDEQLAHGLGNHNHQHMTHVEQPVPTNEPSIATEESLPQSHEQSSQSPFVPDEQPSLEQSSQFLPDQQQPHGQQIHQQFVPDQQPSQPLSSEQPQPLSQPRPLLQPHESLDHLAQQYASRIQQNSQDYIPPRKRSKVSRACDECRRKKVKCDAGSETGEEPCSNCRRSSIRCLFSRIPQKRGPSKGYIKELADRIHHIEGKLAGENNLDTLTELLGGARRGSSDIFSPSAEHEENSRKRPYASISGADFGTPNSSRPGAWNSEPRPIQPYQTPTNGTKGTPFSANGLAPQPLPRPDPDTPSRTAASLEGVAEDLNHSAPTKELISDAFGVYLSVVHPCFPFLAGTKERVEAQLSRCPSLLQDAFTEAFYGTMQSCVSAPGLYTTGDIGSATRMVAEWESDPSSPRNPLANLVHLQTLILMAIATDNYGPLSLKGEHGGPSKASILGRAVGLAYSMRLHMASLDAGPQAQQNGDSDESIATRTWWTLIMLDRWNALSTASPLFIPQNSVVILPGLVSVLGENVYHLTRLSNILGHFAPVSLAPPHGLSPDANAVPILNSFFNLAVELFREVLPTNITPSTHPILILVYWHTRLLSYLFQTNARSEDVIWACKESVDLLLSNTALLSPLNHHFFCLTTLSLLELARLDRTREEVTPLLKDLLERNLAPSTWDGVIRERINERLQPSTSTAQATADQTLQHLAELATASGVDAAKAENNDAEPVASSRTSSSGSGSSGGGGGGSTTYADLGFDPRPILHTGYLNVLAGAPFPGGGPLG